MRITAKADYAVRAAVELAARADAGPVKAEQIARTQGIPPKFLLNILRELKVAGLVQSQRGTEGGYRLARPPDEVTVADVIRAVEGPLATVHQVRPEDVEYPGSAGKVRDVWIAVRASLRAVLETVTINDLLLGTMPTIVERLLQNPDAWTSAHRREPN